MEVCPTEKEIWECILKYGKEQNKFHFLNPIEKHALKIYQKHVNTLYTRACKEHRLHIENCELCKKDKASTVENRFKEYNKVIFGV